jgi:hypothetical protein
VKRIASPRVSEEARERAVRALIPLILEMPDPDHSLDHRGNAEEFVDAVISALAMKS